LTRRPKKEFATDWVLRNAFKYCAGMEIEHGRQETLAQGFHYI